MGAGTGPRAIKTCSANSLRFGAASARALNSVSGGGALYRLANGPQYLFYQNLNGSSFFHGKPVLLLLSILQQKPKQPWRP